MIIGQDKLLNKINQYNLDTFPKTIALIGPEGSGRHLIIDYIANHLNLSYTDITNEISYETIVELNTKVEPNIYILDANSLSIKDENIILKFIEEPLKNSFIIIYCTAESQLIDTVISRCQVWRLDKYKLEHLNKFSSYPLNGYDIHVLDTPGKLLKYNNYNEIKDIKDLASKIFNNIKTANIQNILTLSDKISFNGEENKFDFNLFIDFLLYESMNYFILNPLICKQSWLIYKRTFELSNSRFVCSFNKKQLFEKYLLDLKLIYNME